MVFDTGSESDAHALARLGPDMIGWLTTVTPDGQPQTFPIWFLWEDGEALIYSDRRAKRNGNIAPTRGSASTSTTTAGAATSSSSRARRAWTTRTPAARPHRAYLAKYGAWITEYLSLRPRRWPRSTTSRCASARRAAGRSAHEPAQDGALAAGAAAVGALAVARPALDAIVARIEARHEPAAAAGRRRRVERAGPRPARDPPRRRPPRRLAAVRAATCCGAPTTPTSTCRA